LPTEVTIAINDETKADLSNLMVMGQRAGKPSAGLSDGKEIPMLTLISGRGLLRRALRSLPTLRKHDQSGHSRLFNARHEVSLVRGSIRKISRWASGQSGFRARVRSPIRFRCLSIRQYFLFPVTLDPKMRYDNARVFSGLFFLLGNTDTEIYCK